MQRQTVRLIVVNDSQEVLLAKSALSGSIKFLGGGVEEGETPEEAAIRELAEEAKIKVPQTDLKYLGEVVEIISEDNPNLTHGLRGGETQNARYYLVRSGATAKPGSEIANLAWVSQDEVMETLTYPTQREAYAQLFLGQEESLALKQWTKRVD